MKIKSSKIHNKYSPKPHNIFVNNCERNLAAPISLVKCFPVLKFASILQTALPFEVLKLRLVFDSFHSIYRYFESLRGRSVACATGVK